MDRQQLADFLRRRREHLRPEDVGVSVGARRRVSGLRRGEVADLAGMSSDYYTRLEQGRGPQPSEQMLGALARALRLTADERDHLYRISGHNAPGRTPLDTHVAPQLQRVLDCLDHTPALVLSSLAETLVQNRLAATLFGDRTRFTGLARSGIYRWFTDPAERAVYPTDHHPRQSRAHVASLRLAYGLAGADSRAGHLVRALRKESDEFRDLWQRHEVATRFDDHKTLLHPEVGAMDLDCQALLTEDQSQTLLILSAPPRTEAAEKLALLRILGHEQFVSPAQEA
ncbi:helix-turn-helix transcriptional regulator [Myceligenerans pegani]|uniref:Helix-turn-helix domain-containing protein n=1 Tax=Myceligenerans pegani TaxID=2776917 RepID=A0ABR9MWC8_9MICO|nr:helix-turn-helix transcriptional regulator [Myceligenerans sp. TRM 65318]MBE1875351.1 helix-turn-helix domain-containing protein [Myceligenerans sp. TRM 65318]MBE3017622.1 helix-turn-helix domain-containing protein [Myceligenerans sp. TRM 65318]